jgi:hypothetical protein
LRGSKKGAGRVGGRRGREIRRRARVCTRWSTASAGRAELIGRVHGAEREREREREEGCAGQRLSAWRTGPARQKKRRDARGEATGADRSAPTGRERERERERERGRESSC